MIAARITLVAMLFASAGAPAHAMAPAGDVVAPQPAVADPQAARTEAARGEALFAEGRFDEASAAYERAYELDPFAPFLFARARSEQEAGRCDSAIELYRQFIATQPPQADVDRANMEIGRCYGETRAADPPPRDAPVPPPIPVKPPADPPAPPRDAWHKDPAGGALLGVGLVVLATGLGLFLAGDATHQRAAQAETTDAFRKQIGRGRALVGSGIAGISLGSALIVGAIARYAVLARKARRARAR
jgi:tetratricopeptide (TPR) repeat protein